jgi:hypothetical protein
MSWDPNDPNDIPIAPPKWYTGGDEPDFPWVGQEPEDLRGPAIVVRGSVLSGFQFYGPFDTIDAAHAWCATQTLSGLVGLSDDSIVLPEAPRDDGVVV